jgi:uncharacterized membrane protein YsdA (DUF1294 family)
MRGLSDRLETKKPASKAQPFTWRIDEKSETHVELGSRGFFLASKIFGRKKTRKAFRLAGLA